MNSEKIKALKEFIESSAGLGCYYKLANCEITMLEVFEYINELESELEKEQINNLNCDTELQYKEKRIAELEKENETKTDTITDLLKKQEFYETEKLKKFAERLKEKCKERYMLLHNHTCFGDIEFEINKTLNEFINLGGEK